MAAAKRAPGRRTPPAPRRRKERRALILVALCFLGSAGLRALDAGAAFASETTATADAAPAETAPAPDPGALLAALRAREAQLDARAEELEDRARTIEAAESRLKAQIAALEETEARLRETLAIADRAAEKDIMRLVKVYETMAPKNAAPIFESMDVTFAAGFLSRMREESAARVLAGMSAARAYAISAVIAGRNADAPTE